MYTKHVVNIYIYTTYLHVFKPMCKRLKRRYEYGNSKSINGKIGYRTAFIDLNKINDDVQLNAINDVNNGFIVQLLRGATCKLCRFRAF